MEIAIKSEKANPLLKRREIVAEVKQDKAKTVPRVELQKLLASNFNVPEDSVIIEKISTSFGTWNCVVDAKIYEKKEDIPKSKSDFAAGRLVKGVPKAKEKKEKKEEKKQ